MFIINKNEDVMFYASLNGKFQRKNSNNKKSNNNKTYNKI